MVIAPVLAPMDFLIPISLVLSVTDTSMIFIMPIPPTRSDINATRIRNVLALLIIVSIESDMSAML